MAQAAGSEKGKYNLYIWGKMMRNDHRRVKGPEDDKETNDSEQRSDIQQCSSNFMQMPVTWGSC